MPLKWYMNEVISSEMSSDQAFAWIFKFFFFYTSYDFSHLVQLRFSANCCIFRLQRWNEACSTLHAGNLCTAYDFCSCWGFYMLLPAPFWMRGLVAFGIVLPSSEPTGWTGKFSVPVMGLKVVRHSAFMKIYSNGASFHKRMAAARSKPVFQFWTAA